MGSLKIKSEAETSPYIQGDLRYWYESDISIFTCPGKGLPLYYGCDGQGLATALKYMEFVINIERCILRAHMYEVTCLPCGIRERFSEEDEAIIHAYNHERVLTHSTSSGYFVSVDEV